MRRTTTSTSAAPYHNTEKVAVFSSPYELHRVQPPPSSHGVVEPFPNNPESLTDEFFAERLDDRNLLLIQNWTEEIQSCIGQFEPIPILAKHLGTHVTGEYPPAGLAQPAN